MIQPLKAISFTGPAQDVLATLALDQAVEVPLDLTQPLLPATSWGMTLNLPIMECRGLQISKSHDDRPFVYESLTVGAMESQIVEWFLNRTLKIRTAEHQIAVTAMHDNALPTVVLMFKPDQQQTWIHMDYLAKEMRHFASYGQSGMDEFYLKNA